MINKKYKELITLNALAIRGDGRAIKYLNENASNDFYNRIPKNEQEDLLFHVSTVLGKKYSKENKLNNIGISNVKTIVKNNTDVVDIKEFKILVETYYELLAMNLMALEGNPRAIKYLEEYAKKDFVKVVPTEERAKSIWRTWKYLKRVYPDIENKIKDEDK